MVGDHCTQIFGKAGQGGYCAGEKWGGDVWVVALLGFGSHVVIFIAVATF